MWTLTGVHCSILIFSSFFTGAGYHSDSNSRELKTLCRSACSQVIEAVSLLVTRTVVMTLFLRIVPGDETVEGREMLQ